MLCGIYFGLVLSSALLCRAARCCSDKFWEVGLSLFGAETARRTLSSWATNPAVGPWLQRRNMQSVAANKAIDASLPGYKGEGLLGDVTLQPFVSRSEVLLKFFEVGLHVGFMSFGMQAYHTTAQSTGSVYNCQTGNNAL